MDFLCHKMIFFLLQIAHAYQQTGFKRVKRGYKQLRLQEERTPLLSQPTDPYFPYQWYLVSICPL